MQEFTSDAGLLAYCKLDDAMGLTKMAAGHLNDYRTGNNTQHTLPGMFRQSAYGRLDGYEDVNDADGILKAASSLHRLNRKNVNHAPMPSAFRMRLVEEFRNDIRKLSDILDRDLSHWNR